MTVGGIWAVAIGVTRVVLAFEVKHLPEEVDRALAQPAVKDTAPKAEAPEMSLAATGH